MMSPTERPEDHLSDVGLNNYMKEFHQHPNSRMSITFNSSKGLQNAPGQNNCFLNSAVQVLWHLDAFRRSFRLLSGHSCMGNACIFCALKVMFTQFQYSDKAVLPPDALRLAMAETFANQHRFQLGYMDDAAECFENMLLRMHTHIAPEEKDDFCTAKHCIPHQKFTMSILEQVVCECGAKSEPFTFNEMVFYVSTGALVNEAKAEQSLHASDICPSFSELLKNTVAKGDVRGCPNNCGRSGEKRRNLLNCPDVVSIGLVWDSAKSGMQHIRDVVHYIGTSLELNQLFHTTTDEAKRCEPLKLVGVVCYYGKHYSTFFFHSKVQEWIYFDDAAVKQISDNWQKVCEKLCKGRHQPLLLLYMNPNTKPVSLESAPRFSTMAAGYEWKEGESGNDIGTESPVQRSKTPGPEHYQHNDVEIIPRRAFTPGPDSVNRFAEDMTDYGDYSNNHGFYQQSPTKPSNKPTRHDSLLSAITRHSSDSGSSTGPATRPNDLKVARQSSDAGSYSSRASTVSSTTCSSPLESDDYGYTLSNSHHIRRPSPSEDLIHKTINGKEKKDKSRVSLKKKKQKQKLGADVVRYQSSSSLVHPPLSPVSSYDDSSLLRKESSYSNTSSTDNNPGYATLPRKKKSVQSASSPTKHDREAHTAWMKDIAIKGEAMKQEEVQQSVNDRIHMFNGMTESDKSAESQSTPMPLESMKKPLLQYNAQSKPDGEIPSSYISRSNVEKILYQQRKAAKIPPAHKILKPTPEQFAPPNEYLNSVDSVKTGPKADQPDNMSINSLKDSGYRSCGDRTSTSASSVSSLSIESPTTNRSFSFDGSRYTEPEYSEVPLVTPQENNKQSQFTHARQQSDDFEFPPPPSDLELNGNHTKQLSEASVLSEASTLKQRKTPSVESLDSQNRTINEQMSCLSVTESKCKQMCNNADDMMTKSVERENKEDLSTALLFCNQAISMLSSALAQRPEDSQMLRSIQNKQDSCICRAKTLHTKIVREKELEAGLIENVAHDNKKDKRINRSCSQVERKTMGDLHISNQIKRETASQDYTPLYNAVRSPPQYNQLPRAETRQPLNSKSSSERDRSSISSSHSSSSRNSQQPTQSNNQHYQQTTKPSTSSMFEQFQNRQPRDRRMSEGHNRNDSGSRSNSSDQGQQKGRSACHSSAVRSASQPQPVPTDYIPPPKEFQAPQPPTRQNSVSARPTIQPRVDSSVDSKPTRTANYAPLDYSNHRQPPTNYVPVNYNSSNSINGLQNRTSQYTNNVQKPANLPARYNHYQPTLNQQQQDIYREVPLPPKMSISKEGIRNLLVQDMLKRKGQPVNDRPSQYDPLIDTPMWIPPQQSEYERGYSHYDQPTHRQNQYGRVNNLPDGRMYQSNQAHNARASAPPKQRLTSNTAMQRHANTLHPLPLRPDRVREGPLRVDHNQAFHQTEAYTAACNSLRSGVN